MYMFNIKYAINQKNKRQSIEDDYSNKSGEAEYKMDVMFSLVKENTSQIRSKTSGMSDDKDDKKDGHILIQQDSPHVNPLEV